MNCFPCDNESLLCNEVFIRGAKTAEIGHQTSQYCRHTLEYTKVRIIKYQFIRT